MTTWFLVKGQEECWTKTPVKNNKIKCTLVGGYQDPALEPGLGLRHISLVSQQAHHLQEPPDSSTWWTGW